MTPAPTWRTIGLHWTLEPGLAIVVVVAAAVYVTGVRRLARRGRRWSPARTTAFAAGLAAIVVATQSGLARYETILFSLHTAQHVLLGMVAPFLLALGAPITLALQAAHRPTQARLLRVIHSRPVALLTHPLVAWSVFGGTLFALYLSPLFEWSLRDNLLHATIHLHFLLAGALFFWPAVGLDPVRRPLSHPARLLYVLFAVPVHAFLGLAVLSSKTVIGGSAYRSVHRTWGASPLADQRTGAAILWAVGDLFGLVAGAVVVAQWVRYDERRQAREDRRLDAEAAAAASDA